MANLCDVLSNVLSNDLVKRNEAEKTLKKARTTDFTGYCIVLAEILLNNNLVIPNKDSVRQIAGILLKNCLTPRSADGFNEQQIKKKWFVEFEEWKKNNLKSSILSYILTNTETSDQIISILNQVISRIACLELQVGWPELFKFLQTLMQNSNLFTFGLMLISYLLEDIINIQENIETDILKIEERMFVFKYVIEGLASGKENTVIYALKSFDNAIMFSSNIINCKDDVVKLFGLIDRHFLSLNYQIRLAAWEVLLQAIPIYYDYFIGFINPYVQLTIHTMTINDSRIDTTNIISESLKKSFQASDQILNTLTAEQIEILKISALEFWSVLCDEELYLIERKESCHYFISMYKDSLLPILFELSKNVETEYDPLSNEFTISKASCICVSLCANVLKNEILPYALTFITNNWSSSKWQDQEAALFVFSAILCGATPNKMESLIDSTIAEICVRVKSTVVAIADAAVWAIACAAKQHMTILRKYLLILPNNSPGIVPTLLSCANSDSTILKTICIAFYNIFANYNKSVMLGSFDLEKNFNNLAAFFIEIIKKSAANEFQTRKAAYDALYILIEEVDATPSILISVEILLNKFLTWLGETVTLSYSDELGELQAAMIGCMNSLIRKLGTHIQNITIDQIFQIFNDVLRHGTKVDNETVIVQTWSNAAEEVFLALQGLVSVVGNKIHDKLDTIMSYITAAIRSVSNDEKVCIMAIDLCSACASMATEAFQERSNQAVTLLGIILADNQISKYFKPLTINALSDLALLYSTEFTQHLPTFLQILCQAANTCMIDVDQSDEEWEDYCSKLLEATLNGFTSCLYCLEGSRDVTEARSALNNSSNYIVQLIKFVLMRKKNKQEDIEHVLLFLNDILTVCKELVIPLIQKQNLLEIISTRIQPSSNTNIIDTINSIKQHCAELNYN